MKRDLFIRVGLVAIGILLVLNLIVSCSSHTARSFQYKVVLGEFGESGEQKLEAFLNNYAQQGWEFIEHDSQQTGGWIFKK